MERPSKDWNNYELVRRCCIRPHDEMAWDEFVCRFQATIRTTVSRTFKRIAKQDNDRREQFHDDLIDDLVQMVYCRLVENSSLALERFENAHLNSIYRYLMMIAVNVVRDYFREAKALKRPRLSISLDDMVSIDAPAFGISACSGLTTTPSIARPHATATMEDVNSALSRAVSRRNRERDILIFKLHYVEGMTLDEIASVLGKDISKVGINSILTRVTKRVRELLSPPGISD
ncbi:MAG TPA: sigma-70 family RNA polymerase sigma factor [Blastocatellia bacterium]|nr:sigma-70 family RNA polymerase sigma factor [Blastocatellia bacterium]